MKREIELLKEAIFEIRNLRNQNQLMSARLEMFDSMMLVFQSQPPNRNVGMSPDLVWEIEKFIESEKQPAQ